MFNFANLSMLLGFPIIADQFQTKITRRLFHACMILDDIGRLEDSLFIVGNVVVHHDHDVVVRNTMLVQDLVGMADVGLGRQRGEKNMRGGSLTSNTLSINYHHIWLSRT